MIGSRRVGIVVINEHVLWVTINRTVVIVQLRKRVWVAPEVNRSKTHCFRIIE